jgi:hypothetical protein
MHRQSVLDMPSACGAKASLMGAFFSQIASYHIIPPHRWDVVHYGNLSGRWQQRSGRIEARIGLRMTPTCPRSPLTFRRFETGRIPHTPPGCLRRANAPKPSVSHPVALSHITVN